MIKQVTLELSYYKNRKNEPFFQTLLEQHLGGTHKTLYNGITDVTTNDLHAGIKEWKCWKEAVGQLTCYNKADPKPRLALYLFGKYSGHCKQIASATAKDCCLEVYEFKESVDGEVYIEDYFTKEVMYKYKP